MTSNKPIKITSESLDKYLNLGLDYIYSLTDDVGITEHCLFSVPDRKEGYTIDDNARALQVALRLSQANPLKKVLIQKYLKFLLWARSDKGFHNNLNADLSWEESFGVGDWFGHAMTALAETGIFAPDNLKLPGIFVFDQFSSLIKKSDFLRTGAHLIVALYFREMFERKFKTQRGLVDLRKKLVLENKEVMSKKLNWKLELTRLADQLVSSYRQNSDQNWNWYEDRLTYDNPRLPLGLIYAYKVTKREVYKDVALETINFLIQETYNTQRECFSFIGNKGWYVRGERKAIFGQQPLEAGSTVESCLAAYEISGKDKYLDFAKRAFEWYLGRNILNLSLLDKETGGIRDGLEDWGYNPNQGSESVLSFMLAALALKRFLK